METMGPNLLAHVERRHVWFSDDEEPLLGAEHARLGHRVEWLNGIYICFGAQSIEHGNVLSEKINFSAPGGRKVAIFGMEDLDPQYFDVSNFSVPPDPPYMSKNANMCYF